MATCGIQMRAKGKSRKKLFSFNHFHGIGPGILVSAGLLLLCVALSGCMSMQIGSPPRIDALKTLEPGISTKTNIIMALGEPRGFGETRFMPNLDPRKIWFYEYLESDGQRMKFSFLVVLLYNELYEGHFWFSEDHLYEKK